MTEKKYMKYTNNLYASEVYRELERTAVKAGFFKPSNEQILKSAAFDIQRSKKINAPIDVTPSKDVFQDVARLAHAMRGKGFIRLADDIENKLVLFKQAESVLYNVTPESNSDFVHFSHRDGDVEIIEGAGELGKVETIESAARKIRAIVGKEPQGKVNREASLSEIASLVKRAQSALTEYDVTGKKSNESGVTDSMKDELKNIKDGLGRVTALLDVISSDPSISFKDAMTTYLHGEGNKSSLFIELGGNYQVLDDYGKLAKAAFGNTKPQTPAEMKQAALSVINSFNSLQQLNTYLSSFGNYKVAFDKSAQYGMQSGISNPILDERIQAEKTKIKQNADAAANHVVSVVLRSATAAKAEVDKVSVTLNRYKAKAKNISDLLKEYANRTINSLKDYVVFSNSLEKTVSDLNKEKGWASTILAKFQHESAGALDPEIDALKISSDALKSSVAQAYTAEEDDDATEAVRNTSGRLRSIANKITEAKDNGSIKSSSALKHLNKILENVQTIYKIINESVAGGKKYIVNKLKAFDTYEDYAAFDVETQQLLNFVNKIIAQESK